MKPIDYLKALGVAFGVLALNLLITTAMITIYSLAIEPGQPQAYYTAMAPKIGAWSGPFGGAVLMFAAGFLLAPRRAGRSALAFIVVTWGFYLALDAGLGLAATPASALFTPAFALSLGGALAAGLAGAALARWRA